MAKKKTSETITEEIFRNHYKEDEFIGKSAVPDECGFKSKKGTRYKGYPDFFRDKTNDEYCIVVEAKATDHAAAEEEVKHYMLINDINKDIIGIAISGQTEDDIKITYFLKLSENKEIINFASKNRFFGISNLEKLYIKSKYGESVSENDLLKTLTDLNKQFNNKNKIRDTDRSLFFSGLMIALKNDNFRNTYKNTKAPSSDKTKKATVLEAHNLNKAILDAISEELEGKINNLSKELNWRDRFAFINNVDYPLEEYKNIIKKIHEKIFIPFTQEEKQDILGRAYKIFLSRAGKVDNKNIILTPDHIKHLMVRLARLSVNDVVLDTCMGTGGFLMEAMETMIKLAEGQENIIENIKEKQLIGFEIDSVLFALACSNMFLHGDGRTNLIYRNSLLSEECGIVNNRNSDKELLEYIKSLKPTRVIINPPYENNNPINFTIQALKYLEKDGKLIIIMPTPTLTHNQQKGGLAETVLSMAKLDFVIKMPNKLFSEQKRTVNTSIFGFTKTPHKKSDDVLFYNLEDDGFVSVQHKGRIDKNGSWSKIENQVIDIITNSKTKKGICQKKKIYDGNILNCAGFQKLKNGKRVKIDELFLTENGTLASENSIDGDYPFITASEEWKTHNDYTLDTEAIVYAVSAAGSLGRSHYIKGKFVASNLCLVLTPKNNSKYPINMMFYNYYFASIRNQIVSDLADGTSKLTISPTSFREYYIDYVPLEDQNKFVEDKVKPFLELQKKYREAQQLLSQNVINILK